MTAAPYARHFLPFDRMTKDQRVEHLVVAHSLDSDYFGGDTDAMALFGSMTAAQLNGYHAADHADDQTEAEGASEGLGILDAAHRHDHGKVIR